MAEISFGGLATGLPTDEIVQKLMAIERRPLDRLEEKKKSEATRLQAYSQLKTRLDSLRTAADAINLTGEARTTQANVNSTGVLTATSSGAATGSYDIVVKNLAQVEKAVSVTGYSSATTALFGTGSITVNNREIVIDQTNNSLQGVASAINAETSATGVTATIVNNGSGSANAFRLILTGKDAVTGIEVASNLKGSNGAAIPFATTQTQAAKQARLIIDGIDVVSNFNVVTDVISGVTLNLIGTSPPDAGQPTGFTSTRMDVVADNSNLKEKLSAFVSSYNNVMEWIKEGYEITDEKKADGAKTESDDNEESLSQNLRGDATVNSIKRSLQSILTDAVNGVGAYRILSDIGISTNPDATLTLNNAKLESALNKDFDGVVSMIAGRGSVDGVMKKFNSYLAEVTSATDGMYAGKRDSYQEKIKRLDEQIAQKETLMEKIELSMRSRFNSLELLVSNLNSQSSYLTQQMDALAKMTGNNS